MLHAKSTLVFQSPEVWHKGRKITAMRTSSESARLLWTLPSEASCYPAFVELCHFFPYHKEYKWINDDQFSHSSQPRQLIVLPCARSTFARFTKSLIPTHSRQSKKKKSKQSHTYSWSAAFLRNLYHYPIYLLCAAPVIKSKKHIIFEIASISEALCFKWVGRSSVHFRSSWLVTFCFLMISASKKVCLIT